MNTFSVVTAIPHALQYTAIQYNKVVNATSDIFLVPISTLYGQSREIFIKNIRYIKTSEYVPKTSAFNES